MAMKRVIIVDDEPAARRKMRSVITNFDELTIVAEIGDGDTAIAEIKIHKPDIVFLDVEMPGKNGFDVADATSNIDYQLVFVTAYQQFALQAFNTKAIDYLLKPVRPALIEKCINKILHQQQLALSAAQSQSESGSDSDSNSGAGAAAEQERKPEPAQNENLVLSDSNSFRVVHKAHIIYIESIGRCRMIHLDNEGHQIQGMQTIVSDTTLDSFENLLAEDNFVRLHRSYIVNLEKIVCLSVESRRYKATLEETTNKIPISRSKVSELKALLKTGWPLPVS